MAAIKRICESVTRKSEAEVIRKGVDMVALTDAEQRATLQLAMSRMP